MKHRTVLIIGGGIIGSSIAFELAKKGIQTTIIEKGLCHAEASTAAAGMLGAHVETHQPGAFFELCKASRDIYRQWTDELYEVSRIPAQYIEEGIIRVAMTEDDERELKGRLPWIGDQYKWLSEHEIHRLEPAIKGKVRGGLYFDEDHQVHPVHLTTSLHSAIRKLGCIIKEQTQALDIIIKGNQVIGVKTAKEDLFADQIVITSGAWSSTLLSSIGVTLPMYPVKGQCFAVRPKQQLIQKTIFTHGCYVVPKLDGTLMIGATQEDAGFDKETTQNAINSLNKTAIDILPDLQDAEFVSSWAGLRPATPDGIPYLGGLSDIPGITFATGHYRNGILLAPITGKVMSKLILQETISIDIKPFSPERIAQNV